PSGFVFGSLERDAIHGTRDGAEIAGHASLAAIGIARENDAAAPSRRQIRPLFGILHGHTFPNQLHENSPHRFAHPHHYFLQANATAPVISRLGSASGSMTFHPQAINWSKRGRGSAARRRMKKQMKKNILARNHNSGGNTGPSQPPKNNMVIRAEIRVTPRYSPTKNMPNFIPEYSE